MRICYLGDARSTHTQRWASFFADGGHEVDLVSAEPNFSSNEKITYHNLPLEQGLPALTWWLPKVRAVEAVLRKRRQIRGVAGRISPAVVHAHFACTYGHLAYLAGHRPYIVTAWGSDVFHFRSQGLMSRILTRRALREANLVTCDSEDLKAAIVALGVSAARVEIVHHGVDTGLFRPLPDKAAVRKELGIGPEEMIVLSPRSLRPLYNIDTIVKGFARLTAGIPAARLIVKEYEGSSEYRDSIQALARDLGLSHRVTFVGYGPYEDMVKWYNVADAVVSLATTDSAPMSVLEAMACGAAVIVTDLPSLRDYVTEGVNGHLVDPRNVEQVAEKMRAIFSCHSDVARSRSLANRALVVKRADYQIHMAKMDRLYEGLVEGKAGR